MYASNVVEFDSIAQPGKIIPGIAVARNPHSKTFAAIVKLFALGGRMVGRYGEFEQGICFCWRRQRRKLHACSRKHTEG